jgi:hypothetical protein
MATFSDDCVATAAQRTENETDGRSGSFWKVGHAGLKNWLKEAHKTKPRLSSLRDFRNDSLVFAC